MPAFVKTAHDEKVWSKAKELISKSHGVNEDKFQDKHWAMVNSLFHKLKGSGGNKK